MKRFAGLVVALFLLFPVSVRAGDEHAPQNQPKEQKETIVTYSAVQCGYFTALDTIACGLFPLKQGIGLLMGNYIDQLHFMELVQTAMDAGIKHINEFSYKEENVKTLDIPFESIGGVDEDFNLDNWQMERATFALRSLAGKLAEVRPAVDTMGPRAFELLLKETRDAALVALMEKLHPHTNFYSLESEERKNILLLLRRDIGDSGEKLFGIGASLGEFGSVYVVMPLPNTPAGRALQRYDEILAVDGVSVAKSKEAASKIRGKIGERVTLTILRDGIKMDVVLVREEIVSLPSAIGQLYKLENARVCYLLINHFGNDTDKEVREIFGEHGVCKDADTYALDLRNNGGGLERTALGVAQALLPQRDANAKEELLVEDRGNRRSQKHFRDSTQSIRAWKIKPVVLQNNNSASGSELVIGALRPHVVLIGDRSFGKFSAWAPVILADGSILQITTSNFMFKDGVKYDGKGFMPDIYFNRPMFRREVPKEKVEREENLPKYQGGNARFTEQEKLLMFLSEHDPEFAIGLGLMARPEKLFSNAKGEGK